MPELSALSTATAFGAGVVSFLSPCVLPLVPGYVSYVAGSSLESLRDDARTRLRAVGFALCFIAGFGTIFVALGASASVLGGLLLDYKYELGLVAGVIVMLFGLHLMGITPLRLMQREARFHLDIPGGRVVGAFLMGIAFAFGWTPCIGPVLGAILTMSASTAALGQGTALLAIYALGLGLPFILAALFTDVLLRQLRRLSRAGRMLQRAAGALLVVMGLLIVTGQLQTISYWLLETFPGFAQIG